MNRVLRFSILSLLGCAFLAACSDEPTSQPVVIPTDTTSKMVTLTLESTSGTTPLVLGQQMTADQGSIFKPTKFRYYLSQPALLGAAGDTVPVTMLDSAGAPLPYNILLSDQTKPESQTIRFMARQGSYRGLVFSLGVPVVDATGDSLNHGDASVRTYPLDVDADMYWSWNPGYVFLKFEGQVQNGASWASFSYHVGGDANLARIGIADSLRVDTSGARRTVLVNVNRLFVTPAGAHSPDITKSAHVNGGAMAQVMAGNAAGSGFLSIKR